MSAHAADFCIRAGGTLARYVAGGVPVRVLVMSPGARGESNEMWKARQGKTTEAEVANVRRQEATAAAGILGVDLALFDYPDQPLTFDQDRLVTLTREIKAFRPTILLTHPNHEPHNPDHSAACHAAMEAAYYATLAGVHPELPVITPPQTFAFEPTQPLAETTGFAPDTFIDITDVIDQKMKAVAEYKVQPYHVDRYRSRAVARAAQAAYVAGNPDIKFAEAFQRYTPWTGQRFP
ncbi:MAG: PIG-L deacetylase family protein [Armatimonadota bacterium]